MQIISLYNSLHQRSYSVMISVAGSFVLKHVIPVSTTLFVAEQTLHLEARHMNIQHRSMLRLHVVSCEIRTQNTSWSNFSFLCLRRFNWSVLGKGTWSNANVRPQTRLESNLSSYFNLSHRLPRRKISLTRPQLIMSSFQIFSVHR